MTESNHSIRLVAGEITQRIVIMKKLRIHLHSWTKKTKH